MTDVYVRDGVEYTKSNSRMRYTPEFCENHKNHFTRDDLIYMCSMWKSMKKLDIAMALGRTHSAVMQKAYHLRKIGMFNHYAGLGKE